MKMLSASILSTVAVLSFSPQTSVAQSAPYEPIDEIWCSQFHPGATYEELIELCANDTPPPGFGEPPQNPGDVILPAPRSPCREASHFCHDY